MILRQATREKTYLRVSINGPWPWKRLQRFLQFIAAGLMVARDADPLFCGLPWAKVVTCRFLDLGEVVGWASAYSVLFAASTPTLPSEYSIAVKEKTNSTSMAVAMQAIAESVRHQQPV